MRLFCDVLHLPCGLGQLFMGVTSEFYLQEELQVVQNVFHIYIDVRTVSTHTVR
jgi:hypothetical protein